MMFFNGDISNIPSIFEFIDKIKIMLQPHLLYYLDSNKIFKMKCREIWCTGHKYLDLYVKCSKQKQYLYFIIQGEYINSEANIKNVIIDALYDLVKGGTLKLNQYLQEKKPMQKGKCKGLPLI
jgi:hypothetical protein